MFDIIIRSFIGDAGGRILDFYLEYSLVINGIILLYFVLIMVGRRNFSFVLETLVSALEKEFGDQLKSKNAKQLSSRLNRIDIPWNAGIDSTYFPIITPPGSYRPYLKNTASLQKLYSNEILADAILSDRKD